VTTSKLRAGDVVAGVSGLLLLLVLFAPWYGVLSAKAVFRTAHGVVSQPAGPYVGESAWNSLSVILVFLVLTALLGLALMITTTFERTPAIPTAAAVFGTTIAALTALLVFYRLLNQPGVNALVDVRWGAYAGFLCTVGVGAGAFMSLRRDSRP
jgi:hypothetical protein